MINFETLIEGKTSLPNNRVFTNASKHGWRISALCVYGLSVEIDSLKPQIERFRNRLLFTMLYHLKTVLRLNLVEIDTLNTGHIFKYTVKVFTINNSNYYNSSWRNTLINSTREASMITGDIENNWILTWFDVVFRQATSFGPFDTTESIRHSR